jgi:DNA-binding transcriptional LysR family regulator
MDRLTLVETFVRLAERASFSQAARDLGTSQPTVSRQVRELEGLVGTALVQRTTRRVVLTPAGQRFYRDARELLALYDRARGQAAAGAAELSGTLRIAAPVAFGELVLVRQVIAFRERHPAIKIDLQLHDRYVDLIDEGVDVAIRIGELVDSSLIARRLGRVRQVLVASPAYLRAHGEPRRVRDLARHAYARFGGLRAGQRRTLVGPQGPREVTVGGWLRVNNALAIREAILAGAALGALHEYAVAALIEQGALKRILPRHELPPQDLHALYPARTLTPRTRQFIDFLAAELAAVPGIHRRA